MFPAVVTSESHVVAEGIRGHRRDMSVCRLERVRARKLTRLSCHTSESLDSRACNNPIIQTLGLSTFQASEVSILQSPIIPKCQTPNLLDLRKSRIPPFRSTGISDTRISERPKLRNYEILPRNHVPRASRFTSAGSPRREPSVGGKAVSLSRASSAHQRLHAAVRPVGVFGSTNELSYSSA